jgi:hypothetical protein
MTVPGSNRSTAVSVSTRRQCSTPRGTTNSSREFAAFFAGLELIAPGVVLTVQWQPDRPVRNREQADIYVGVGPDHQEAAPPQGFNTDLFTAMFGCLHP